jgi:hypothetical protein
MSKVRKSRAFNPRYESPMQGKLVLLYVTYHRY